MHYKKKTKFIGKKCPMPINTINLIVPNSITAPTNYMILTYITSWKSHQLYYVDYEWEVLQLIAHCIRSVKQHKTLILNEIYYRHFFGSLINCTLVKFL